jgi:hypothetical protein
MLHKEIKAVYFDNHTEYKNILFGKNVEFLNARRGGTYNVITGLYAINIKSK